MTKNDALTKFAEIFVSAGQVTNLVNKLKECFESAKSDSRTNDDPDGIGYADLKFDGVTEEFSCHYVNVLTSPKYIDYNGDFYSVYNRDKNGNIWVIHIDEYDGGNTICTVYNKTKADNIN